MKQIKFFPALLALVLGTSVVKAQDIHFSQVFETPVLLSPANTGFFNGYVRAVANYRNQWATMNKAYQTMGLVVDGGLFKSKKHPAFLGVGLSMFRDVAGVAQIRKTSALVNLSGLVKLVKKSAMSVGLAGGVNAHNGDYSKLTYASQFNGNSIDPTVNSNETPYRQFTTLDAAAGIAYEYMSFKKDQDHDDMTSFKIALGAFHLNRPSQEYGFGSAYRLPIRYSAALTSVLDIEDTRFSITPAFVYQKQETNEMMLLGSFIKFRMATGTKVTGEKTSNAIGFGLFYRTKDALIPKLSMDFGDVSFGLSYDVNVSGYRTASQGMGGFEVSLRYNNLASSLFESKREFK